MSLIFVSYSRKDQTFALKVCQDLQQQNLPIWIDQLNMPVGESWEISLEKALEQCTHFLIILSKSSVESRNVRNELSIALDKNKIIVPIMIEECSPPINIYTLQYIDFRADYPAAFKKLTAVLPKSTIVDEQSNKEMEERWQRELLKHALEEAKALAQKSPNSLEGKSILIVEDTTELAQVIQATLERMGMITHHETHGTKAVEYLKQHKPDLVLLDIGLPDMTGWAVNEWMKEIYPNEQPIIIVITAYGDPANRLVGKLQRAYDYLIKPFTSDEIERVVKSAFKVDFDA